MELDGMGWLERGRNWYEKTNGVQKRHRRRFDVIRCGSLWCKKREEVICKANTDDSVIRWMPMTRLLQSMYCE